ncbi:MAG TPA: GNAT family protein [Deinococcales bacterium]|nr:GNAT family protein [Deinococcales bacterium]
MVIETERLLLRDYREEDWERVLAYQSDPRYLRYYHWEDRSEGAVREFVRMFLRFAAEEPRRKFQLAVTLRESGLLVGSCGVRLDEAGGWRGDIGYELDPDYWGRGLATEAARAMARFAFERLSLHRLESHCIAENTGSARVLEKLRMRLEGRMRDREFFKGRYWDVLHYAVLEDEWRKGDS